MRSDFITASLIIVSVLLFVVLITIVWINRDTERATNLVATSILGPILLALAILAIQLLADSPKKQLQVPFVLIHDNNLTVAPINMTLSLRSLPGGQGYEHLRTSIDEWKSLNPQTRFDEKTNTERANIALDVLQFAFLRWYSLSHSRSWYGDRLVFPEVAGHSETGLTDDTEDTVQSRYDVAEIAHVLRKNFLFSVGKPIASLNWISGDLLLPRNTKLEATSISRRTITFVNRNVTLNITFLLGPYGNFGFSSLSDKLESHFKLARPFSHESFVIIFEARYNPLLRWSRSTDDQTKWIDNILSQFQADFDWTNVQDALMKVLPNSKQFKQRIMHAP